MLDITQPPKEPLIAASILSADFGAMAQDCNDVLGRGADLLHIDVMDGHFVPNLTMGADMIRGVRRHLPDVFLDVHLMVERPGEYIDAFAQAGANLFAFHLEVCKPMRSNGSDAGELIARIRDVGMSPGMVVNPPTTMQEFEKGMGPYLEDLDLALVMSVNPGRSGQKFIPEALEKTRWLKAHVSPGTRIEMDGGLNIDTTPQAVAAGADVIVTASALFGSDDRTKIIAAMKAAGR